MIGAEHFDDIIKRTFADSNFIFGFVSGDRNITDEFFAAFFGSANYIYVFCEFFTVFSIPIRNTDNLMTVFTFLKNRFNVLIGFTTLI